MGTLKTTNIQTITGSGTLTLGTSGETISFGSGVTGLSYPAFEAYLGSDSSAQTDAAIVKAPFDTELLDTNNCYDNTTNYRFTPTVAGKYYVYSSQKLQCTTSNTMGYLRVYIYKNGSVYKQALFDPNDNQANSLNLFVSGVIDMNGTTDYIEMYGQVGTTGGNTWRFDADIKNTYFGAYRIGV